MRKFYLGSLLLASFIVIYACQPTTDLAKTDNVVLKLPAVPYTYNSESGNDAIPTLGRVLFYDVRLSANNSVSCASCHKQSNGFADNVALSTGFMGGKTKRNSMPIQNLSANSFSNGGNVTITEPDSINGTIDGGFGSPPSLFWDGRETVLQAMVTRPIVNHVEMGIADLDVLASKLSLVPEYSALFTSAFGTSEVTPIKISQALNYFALALKSNNSRFDQMMAGKLKFSPREIAGLGLFNDKYQCNSCHQLQAVNGYQLGGGFVNIGLDEIYADSGRAVVTQNRADQGKFKIPTLRNIMLTAPYMHDGRFGSLDDVFEHYNSGIQYSNNLDDRLVARPGESRKMNISEAEKQDIIVFLATLTDYSMVTDPKFSSPFVPK